MIVLTLFLSGCSVHYLVENTSIAEIPKVKNEWMTSQKICSSFPKLKGKYSDVYDAYQLEGDEFIKIGSYDFGHIKLTNYIDPNLPKKDVKDPKGIVDYTAFYILEESDTYTVRSYHRLKPLAFDVLLDPSKSGFSCKEGKLIYPVYLMFGGGDGSTINLRLYRELYVANDGSLILYVQRSNNRNSIFSPNETNTKHYIYVFKRIGNAL